MKINNTKLARLMAEKSLSVNDLAEMTGLSRGTLSAIRRGKTCYGKTAQAIAEALKIPLEEIVEAVNV